MELNKSNKNGYIHVATDITVKEWHEFLVHDISHNSREVLMKFYYQDGHESSCKKLGELYEVSPSSFIMPISKIGKDILRKLNRFSGDAENDSWTIPMDGKRLDDGLFVWKIKPELVQAIQMYLYDTLILAYKQFRKEKPLEDEQKNGERYKWVLLTNCQGRKIEDVIRKVADENLLYMYNKNVVNWLLQNKKEQFCHAVSLLVNEDGGHLLERMEAYRKEVEILNSDNDKAKNDKANDDRTIAAFLACVYPQKYTFYMDTMYQNLCKYLSVKPKSSKGEKYMDYLRLLQPIVARIKEDDSVYQDIAVYLDGLQKCDLLLAQDICWEFFYVFLDRLPYPFFGFENIWLWSGNEHTFESSTLAIGSSVPGLNFEGCKTLPQLRKAYQAIRNNKDNSVPSAYWKFLKDVKKNDIVVIFQAELNPTTNKYVHKLQGWGTFLSDKYEIDNESENPIFRNVSWKLRMKSPVVDETMHGTLFFQSVNEKSKVLHLKQLLGINKNIETMESSLVTTYKSFLLKNHNMIFTGAPGTGKTYLAKQIAASIIGCDVENLKGNKQFGFVQFHPSYDYTDFVEGLRPSEDESKEFELRQGIFKQFCASALENAESKDFEEAYTKLLDDLENMDEPMSVVTFKSTFGISLNSRGNLNLHTGKNMQKNGVLVREALEATANGQPSYKYWQCYYKGVIELLKSKYGLVITETKKRKDFVFIIDEINRGEISKIFGELFFSIDPGYRGETGIVKTQYQNMVTDGPFMDGFYVPDNVYIIGTMNDIDRSVETLDFAFRRRFPSVEILFDGTLNSITEHFIKTLKEKAKKYPEQSSEIQEHIELVDKVKQNLVSLNNEISDNENLGLGSEYCIGGAYLLKLKDVDYKYENLWKFYIEPVIAEYFRGLPSLERKANIDTLKKVFLTKSNETKSDNEE